MADEPRMSNQPGDAEWAEFDKLMDELDARDDEVFDDKPAPTYSDAALADALSIWKWQPTTIEDRWYGSKKK